MRKILLLSFCVTCAGCFNPVTTASQTPLQKYESALHIYIMEVQRDDPKFAANEKGLEPTPGESGGDGNADVTTSDKQASERIKRAKKILEEAEAGLSK